MKELKFRAYDKDTERMIYSDRHTTYFAKFYFFGMDIKGILRCFWQSHYDDKFGYPAIDDGELDNIMQYTGKKDYRGREIYVGDIVRIKYITNSYNSELYEDIVEVKYNYTVGGYIPFVSDFFCENCDEQYTINEVEVIGNIYKNPELLNDIESAD